MQRVTKVLTSIKHPIEFYITSSFISVKVIEITKAPVTDCVKYSQTFQDTVCDDKLNTEECMYDGGDCCLEEKTTSYCMNCSCIVSGI